MPAATRRPARYGDTTAPSHPSDHRAHRCWRAAQQHTRPREPKLCCKPQGRRTEHAAAHARALLGPPRHHPTARRSSKTGPRGPDTCCNTQTRAVRRRHRPRHPSDHPRPPLLARGATAHPPARAETLLQPAGPAHRARRYQRARTPRSTPTPLHGAARRSSKPAREDQIPAATRRPARYGDTTAPATPRTTAPTATGAAQQHTRPREPKLCCNPQGRRTEHAATHTRTPRPAPTPPHRAAQQQNPPARAKYLRQHADPRGTATPPPPSHPSDHRAHRCRRAAQQRTRPREPKLCCKPQGRRTKRAATHARTPPSTPRPAHRAAQR